MLSPSAIVAALEAAGFTHLVWIPDSYLGTWEATLQGSKLSPIRVTREGEAIGIATGLMLGGAKPLVAMQCTGFFEAGDALRNVAYDLKLPLKLIVGVRSLRASRAGKSNDNCPHFSEKIVTAWELPWSEFDPATASEEQLGATLRTFAEEPGPGVILWVE